MLQMVEQPIHQREHQHQPPQQQPIIMSTSTAAVKSSSSIFDEELCHYIAEECSLDYLFYMKGEDEPKHKILNDRANILADWLNHAYDVSPGTKVHLDITNDSLRLVTLIAVLKCGGAVCIGSETETPGNACCTLCSNNGIDRSTSMHRNGINRSTSIRLTDAPPVAITANMPMRNDSRTNSFDSSDSNQSSSDSGETTNTNGREGINKLSFDDPGYTSPPLLSSSSDDVINTSPINMTSSSFIISIHDCPLSGKRTPGNISNSSPSGVAFHLGCESTVTHKQLVFRVLRSSTTRNVDLFETLQQVYKQLSSNRDSDSTDH